MSAYSKSGSSDKAAKIRSNSPLSAHRRKRFHTEDHLPKLSGRSRHGAPARTSHKTASINSLLSSPDRPGSPFLPGRRGAIRSHWASFNNVRLKADPHFFSLESDLNRFENLSPPTRVNLSQKLPHQAKCLQTLMRLPPQPGIFAEMNRRRLRRER